MMKANHEKPRKADAGRPRPGSGAWPVLRAALIVGGVVGLALLEARPGSRGPAHLPALRPGGEPSATLIFLPSERRDGAWPLPRPVLVIRPTAGAGLRECLGAVLDRPAGEPAQDADTDSGGKVTAYAESGAASTGCRLRALVDLPILCPSFAFTEDRIVVSPFRSAVEETVAALHASPRSSPVTGAAPTAL